MVLVPRLFLIDSFGFIFRAYHARARSGAPPMRTAAGISTEAVYIFHNMVRKLKTQHKPEYLAAIFESQGPTFRDEAFEAYKANRTETPPDLLEQIPWIRKVLEAMRIPVLEYPGFEADDVIGTLSRRAEGQGVDVVIVSSDKDMLQLVDDHTSMLNPMKDDAWYDAAETEKFMGVKPSQVADLLALKGDSVDNIPGAPGIGDKGARDLIVQFGSVEQALERAGEVERKMYRESLQNNRERILMSKRLATVETAIPLEFSLDMVKVQEPDQAALKELFKELEFHSLARELGPGEDSRPRDYQALATREAVAEWLDAIPAGTALSVAVSRTEEGEFPLDTVGLAWRQAEARAIPVTLIDAVRPLIADAARPKIGCDVKSTLLALSKLGIDAAGFAHDVMLYAFLLDAEPGGCTLAELVRRRLDLKLGASPEQHADYALELCATLRGEIETRGLTELYESIELPLAGVLARMEREGI